LDSPNFLFSDFHPYSPFGFRENLVRKEWNSVVRVWFIVLLVIFRRISLIVACRFLGRRFDFCGGIGGFFRAWIVFEQFGDFVCGIEWPLLRLVGGGDNWKPSWG
jgi:hypothetical protein